MKNQPAVSIFIVTYLTSEERCNVLRRTCEVALAQNYENFEVVVSDNGGSHSAVEALSIIQDPRLKVFPHEENVGFAGNINRCLEHCAHDIIKPLCDDDLIHPDFLATTVPLVDDETFVVADVEKFVFGSEPEGMNLPAEGVPPTEQRAAGYRPDIWRLSFSASSIPSAIIYTRNLFRFLGGFDGKTITADWDFFIEACLYKKVVHVQQTLCYVGVWGGSLTEEMLERPFFYPQAGLYTKIRVLRCKRLPLRQRGGLLLELLKGLFLQSLRPLKRLDSKAHRSGYWNYLQRFFTLMFQKKKNFGSRPNNP
jgi:glycosyltransferase involved in cell wall biosynthesis